jgi:hypothetical protein
MHGYAFVDTLFSLGPFLIRSVMVAAETRLGGVPGVVAAITLTVSLLGTFPSGVVSLRPHGWDCIGGSSCLTNSMLAGNWAISNPNFNNTDLWWAKTIVSSYAALAINFDGGDPSRTVTQARLLKQLNPEFKVCVCVCVCVCARTAIKPRSSREHHTRTTP